MTEEEERLRLQAEINAIAANMGEMDPDDQRKLRQGMRNVPVSKMLTLVLNLDNNILPKALERHGAESASYQTYRDMRDALLYAILAVDRYELLQRFYLTRKMQEQFWREQVLILEKELAKYYALEDLTLTESLESYAKAIAMKAEDMLRQQ